jgi:hypothetical protein
VRRFVAAVLACGLVVSSTVASSLHVHEYVGHDHPEHHHGPAAHDHGHSTAVDGDHHPIADDHSAIQAESCDPGRHAVSIAVGCAYVPQVHIDLAELPRPTTEAPSSVSQSAITPRDVRVHGPPFDARIPSRAPPVIPHA